MLQLNNFITNIILFKKGQIMKKIFLVFSLSIISVFSILSVNKTNSFNKTLALEEPEISFTGSEFEYDGTPKTPTVNVPEGVDYKVKYEVNGLSVSNVAPIYPGTYSMVVDTKANKAYSASHSSQEFTITNDIENPAPSIYLSGYNEVYSNYATNSINNILDGDEDTFLWMDCGQFDYPSVEIDFNQEIKLYNINLSLGKSVAEGQGDYLNANYDLEYKDLEGNYQTIGSLRDKYHLNYHVDGVDATAVRIIKKQSCSGWIAIREFLINNTSAQTILEYSTPDLYDRNHADCQANIYNLLDNNLKTDVWFKGSLNNDHYIKLDLGEKISLSDIEVFQDKNDGTAGNVYYSLDDVEHTLFGSFAKAKDYDPYTEYGDKKICRSFIDRRGEAVEARYIYLKEFASSSWVQIFDIRFNAMAEVTHPGVVSISNIDLEGGVANTLNDMIDSSDDSFVWFGMNKSDNAEIKVTLEKSINAKGLKVLMGNKKSPNDYFHNYIVSVSSDDITYQVVGTYVDTKEALIDLNPLEGIQYIKITSLGNDDNGIIISSIRVFEEVEQADVNIIWGETVAFEYDGQPHSPTFEFNVPYVNYSLSYTSVHNGYNSEEAPTWAQWYGLEVTVEETLWVKGKTFTKVFHIDPNIAWMEDLINLTECNAYYTRPDNLDWVWDQISKSYADLSDVDKVTLKSDECFSFLEKYTYLTTKYSLSNPLELDINTAKGNVAIMENNFIIIALVAFSLALLSGGIVYLSKKKKTK